MLGHGTAARLRAVAAFVTTIGTSRDAELAVLFRARLALKLGAGMLLEHRASLAKRNEARATVRMAMPVPVAIRKGQKQWEEQRRSA